MIKKSLHPPGWCFPIRQLITRLFDINQVTLPVCSQEAAWPTPEQNAKALRSHSQCPGQRGSRPPRRSWVWCNLCTPATTCARRPPPSPAGWGRTRSCSQWKEEIKSKVGIQLGQTGIKLAAAYPSLAPSRCMPVHPVTESVSMVGNSSYWGPRASCWYRNKLGWFTYFYTLKK